MSAKVTCSGCESEIERRDAADHDCLAYLKASYADQKECFAKQKRRLQALTGIDPDDRAKYPMHCYKKHRIRRYEAGCQNRRRSKITGQWIETSDRQCVVCDRRWDSKDSAYNACSEGCDFDICDRCGCCNEKHLLEIRVARPWVYENVYCNRCRKDQTDYVISCGLLACDECRPFYLCRKCVPRPNHL